MSAAPSNLSKNEVENIDIAPFGMVEDDALCMVKVITDIVKDTDYAASFEVVAKRMVIGADHIKTCRKHAESDQEEIS